MRRYQEPAFRTAYLVLRDAPEAEDAAQDAFVKAWGALHRFRTGSMRPWLLKIVKQSELLRKAVEALKEQERTLIYLRFFLTLSEQELAEYFKCAPGTIKSRLSRTLVRLREVVARDYPGLNLGGVQ